MIDLDRETLRITAQRKERDSLYQKARAHTHVIRAARSIDDAHAAIVQSMDERSRKDIALMRGLLDHLNKKMRAELMQEIRCEACAGKDVLAPQCTVCRGRGYDKELINR